MSAFRILCAVFLFIAAACGSRAKEQPAETVQPVERALQQPDSILQSDTTFSRLYTSAGLEEPMQIAPLASTSFVVEEDDLRDGVGPILSSPGNLKILPTRPLWKPS